MAAASVIFGIAAARHQGADRAADRLLGAFAGSDHQARDFEAGNVRCPRRRRVQAHALQDVRTVDAGGGDPDEHLSRTGPGHRPLGQAKHLGPARLGDLDRSHFLGNIHGAPY
jgi:hypothetical protein